jgi:hypothetical protein
MGLLISVADYEDAAIRYHCKFLQVQAFLTKAEKARDLLANSGNNNNLPKTPMPWILPLDVPVPGLPSQTTN